MSRAREIISQAARGLEALLDQPANDLSEYYPLEDLLQRMMQVYFMNRCSYKEEQSLAKLLLKVESDSPIEGLIQDLMDSAYNKWISVPDCFCDYYESIRVEPSERSTLELVLDVIHAADATVEPARMSTDQFCAQSFLNLRDRADSAFGQAVNNAMQDQK